MTCSYFLRQQIYLKFISVNTLKAIELHTLNGWFVWYVSHITIKLLLNTHTHTHTHTHKNTGVNCHALLQGIFLTPEIKPSFPPSPALAGRLFITRSMYSLPLWMWMEREDDVGWHPGFWIGLWCICKKPELSNVHHVFDSFYRVSSIRSLQNVFLPF